MTGAIGSTSILAGISAGELIDKITILEIKEERIVDPAKLANVRYELAELRETQAKHLVDPDAISGVAAELKDVNLALWEIEDAIRDCERRGDFGSTFVELARSVYKTNDRRSALKRKLNQMLGSQIVEEKSYEQY